MAKQLDASVVGRLLKDNLSNVPMRPSGNSSPTYDLWNDPKRGGKMRPQASIRFPKRPKV